MMGGHHAISGAAAWMALAGSASMMGHPVGLDLWELDGAQVISGAVVATGAALLPDIDHSGATISRSGGGLTKAITRTVGSVAGHRGATHTLLAVLAFTALAMLVGGLDHQARLPVLGEIPTGPVVLVGVMCALGTRALKGVDGLLLPWLVGLASALAIAVIAPEATFWLPAAVAVGTLTHLVGDLLTTDGIPFPTWPLVVKPPKRFASALWQRNGDVALPLLGDAGSAREWLLCTALTAYTAVTTVAALAGLPGMLAG
ncbi:MAG: metal-dependent hydrolase [Brachybacterium sp.]|uniref:metal-dependent hydrolase n=1 Tax=Brachybacterium sp. TaxID=1891286 RepID=UPI002648E671|nr:metal-dependent hydrolase [Brachybacterium sp.]MDN5685260.1 metal-dependent hydrolase [Brachybacterium sp.]